MAANLLVFTSPTVFPLLPRKVPRRLPSRLLGTTGVFINVCRDWILKFIIDANWAFAFVVTHG